jgi:SAM-dependent methyltransferase
MEELPKSEVYEQEFKYFPWGILIKQIIPLLIKNIPKNARVLDLMCGPGYLLGKIQEKRPDLKLVGVDIKKEFIESSKKKYPKIEFFEEDSLIWASKEKFDVVICTAGIHHLPYERQEEFVAKINKMLNKNGFFLSADPFIGDFNNKSERKLAAAKLGYEYLVATIKNNPPKEIVEAALDIMNNDVKMEEFKTSVRKFKEMAEKYFKKIEMHKTWPQNNSDFGEYYFILR